MYISVNEYLKLTDRERNQYDLCCQHSEKCPDEVHYWPKQKQPQSLSGFDDLLNVMMGHKKP